MSLIRYHKLLKIAKLSVKSAAMTDWDYSNEKGPQTWFRKYPAAAGKKQSPIDIRSDQASPATLAQLKGKYNTDKIRQELHNVGYCWKVVTEGSCGDLGLSGGPLQDEYKLLQYHCHWGDNKTKGSEHAIDGQKFDGEIHFVHINARYSTLQNAIENEDGLCVLGVFLKCGSNKNPEIAKIVDVMRTCMDKDAEAKLEENVNIAELIPFSSTYYTYSGSLTTPPCNECTTWIVFSDPVEISHSQLCAFNHLKSGSGERITNNFRPLMPIGDRKVVKVLQKEIACSSFK